MNASRREFTLSSDQPILRRARRRRRRSAADAERAEIHFWRSFDLDKLARGWRHALGGRQRQG